MKLNMRCRSFHDPWGNKYGNRHGSVIRMQYAVSHSELDSGGHVNNMMWYFNTTKRMDYQYDRFVHGSKVEALKK